MRLHLRLQRRSGRIGAIALRRASERSQICGGSSEAIILKKEKRLIDITRAIAAGMAVYPGNPEVSMAAVATIPRNSSNTSLISMGTHTGTHVDSPLHINNNKPGVDRIPLSRCYGRCTVIDTTSVPFGKGIEEKHIKDHGIKKGEIILLKTRNSSLELDRFRKDFIFLANSGAEFLARKKVKAVGIDYLSVQQFHSPKPAAHDILIPKGIVVFEGLDLSKARPGVYTFIGFPMKIKDGNGAPVRAVLLKR